MGHILGSKRRPDKKEKVNKEQEQLAEDVNKVREESLEAKWRKYDFDRHVTSENVYRFISQERY